MPPPTGIFQIRGPAAQAQPQRLVGRQVLVVGGLTAQQLPAAGFVSDRLLAACFAALAGANPAAVAILMAETNADRATLAQRWGQNQSTPGFFVGRQTTAAGLQQAINNTGQGQLLRVLIAADVAVRDALTDRWDNT